MSAVSPQKKRRRESVEGERPRKKIANGSESVKFSSLRDVGEWAPALVIAPGLDYEFKEPMEVYSRTRSVPGEQSKEEILLHSSDHPKLDYVAREEKAGNAESLLQHYIAVHDPKAGDTKVVPVRKLVLRSTLKSARAPPVVEINTPARKTAVESRTMLGQAFGTKKSQKALRSLTENAITSPEKAKKDSKGKVVLEDAAAMVLDTMAESTTLPTRQDLQDAIDDAKPRPKANLAAQTASEVYPLELIAGKEVYQRLSGSFLQNAVKKKQDVVTVSRYFSSRLRPVVAEKVEHKLKALRLLLMMIEWRKTFKSKGRDQFVLQKDEDIKDQITDFDPVLLGKIKRKFAPEASLTPWHIDNICTHICALALIIDNFAVDTFEIRQDLSLENRKIIQYFKELGCRTAPPKENDFKDLGIKTKTEANNHTIAKLRIPLVFPKMRTPMRRR